jgi:hypothetical protein
MIVISWKNISRCPPNLFCLHETRKFNCVLFDVFWIVRGTNCFTANCPSTLIISIIRGYQRFCREDMFFSSVYDELSLDDIAKLWQNHGMDTCSWNSFFSMDILGLAKRWMPSHGTEDSVILLDKNDVGSFRLCPETF